MEALIYVKPRLILDRRVCRCAEFHAWTTWLRRSAGPSSRRCWSGWLALALLYVLAWRRGRATGSSATSRAGAGCCCSPAGWLLILVALVSPDRRARRPAAGHAHGPAHPAARHRPDPADPRAHQGAAAPGDPPAEHGSSAAPATSPIPAFAVLAYAGFMWLWHIPAMYDARAAQHRHPRPRAHLLRRRRHALLVASALADPQPHAARRDGPGRLHGVHQAAGRDRWGSCSPSRPTAFYPFYEHHPHYWGLSPARGSVDGRAADGARAVDRDGDRARRACSSRC